MSDLWYEAAGPLALSVIAVAVAMWWVKSQGRGGGQRARWASRREIVDSARDTGAGQTFETQASIFAQGGGRIMVHSITRVKMID